MAQLAAIVMWRSERPPPDSACSLAHAATKSPTTQKLKRDKVSLDIFWLKDESLEDSANLPAPDVIAAEIAEDLQAALDQFTSIAADLRK